MAEMKAEGVEYDQRMEELEKLEYPKPPPRIHFILRSICLRTAIRGWGKENIRPKNIVREMFEQYRSFADYIKDYELQRADGLLLRHINSVYKVLALAKRARLGQDRTSPRNGTLLAPNEVRQVRFQLDGGMQERMRDPNYVSGAKKEETLAMPWVAAPPDITRDEKEFYSVYS